MLLNVQRVGTPLLQLPPLYSANVVKRPSATIKSPYVADILIDGKNEMCHTPGLGCCGLVESGRHILVGRNAGKSVKTAWTSYISECADNEGAYYVGIHPMISQKVATHLLSRISASAVWKSEVVVEAGTRLDFVGSLSSGKKIYVEVKNAMISRCLTRRAERRAIFPDGFRKKKSEPVSPRAVKHAQTLQALLDRVDTEACVLLYIVPRNDCGDGLELNVDDPIYVSAVRSAILAGVQVRVFSLDFQQSGFVYFGRELPFHIELATTNTIV